MQNVPSDAEVHAFFASAQEVTLSAEEKEEAFACLSAEMPAAAFFAAARDIELEPHEKTRGWSGLTGHICDTREMRRPARWSLALLQIRWSSLAVAMVLVVAAGAGMSYAAESALPGDFLYPVKRVNESIQSSLSFTTESHTETSANHLERRLKEAKVLQETKRLDDTESVVVDAEFRTERRQVLSGIQRLEEEGNMEQASSMRARLNAYMDAYDRMMHGRPVGSSTSGSGASASVQSSVSASGSFSAGSSSTASSHVSASAQSGSARTSSSVRPSAAAAASSVFSSLQARASSVAASVRVGLNVSAAASLPSVPSSSEPLSAESAASSIMGSVSSLNASVQAHIQKTLQNVQPDTDALPL